MLIFTNALSFFYKGSFCLSQSLYFAITDLSHSRAVIDIEGNYVLEVLNKDAHLIKRANHLKAVEQCGFPTLTTPKT